MIKEENLDVIMSIHLWGPTNRHCPSGPAHITNPKPSQPMFRTNTHQGNLTHTNHNPAIQLS